MDTGSKKNDLPCISLRDFLRLAGVVVCLAILAACSQGLAEIPRTPQPSTTAPPNETSPATNTPAPTETPQPTPTETPTLTPEPTATEQPKPTATPPPTATPEKTSCADIDYARSFSEEIAQEAGFGSLNEAVTKWVQDDVDLKEKFDKARGDALIGLASMVGGEEVSLLNPIGFYIGSFEINVPAGQTAWEYAYDGFSGTCLVHAVPYKKDGKLEVMALPLIVSAHGKSVDFDTYVFEQGVGLLKLPDLKIGDKLSYNYLIYQSKEESQLQMEDDLNPRIYTKFTPFYNLIGEYVDYLFNPQHRQELFGFSDRYPSTLDQYLAVFSALNGGRVAPLGWPVWRIYRYK